MSPTAVDRNKAGFFRRLLQSLGVGPLTDKSIDKISKLAANAFAQPEVRMREMQRLIKDGRPQAIRGVLRRFNTQAQGHIADEEEKAWLAQALSELGEPARAPLEDFIGHQSKLTHAMRAYRNIVGEAATAFFLAALATSEPQDYQRVEAKLQLAQELGEHLDDARVLIALVPHLADHSDDVRWAVMDIIEKAHDKEQISDAVKVQITEQLAPIVTDPQQSARIAERAALVLVTLKMPLDASVAQLSPSVAQNFFLDGKRNLHPRVST